MEQKSPFQWIREVDAQVRSILSYVDADALPVAQRELVMTIKRELTDARLDLRDYGMAETKSAQRALATAAHKRLEHLQKHIVKASEYNLFGAADVAQLSASIEQMISGL